MWAMQALRTSRSQTHLQTFRMDLHQTHRQIRVAAAHLGQVVFRNQAAAAQVERDFSACGNLLVPNRSHIDTHWVHMVILLKASFEHIPEHGHVPIIAAKDIRKNVFSAQFAGQDADLLAAEAALSCCATPRNLP